MKELNKYTAVITVVGTDKPGIIYAVTGVLAKKNVNIINISQNIMEDMFQMVMLIDTDTSDAAFEEIAKDLEIKGQEISCQIRLQSREVFTAMHRI